MGLRFPPPTSPPVVPIHREGSFVFHSVTQAPFHLSIKHNASKKHNAMKRKRKQVRFTIPPIEGAVAPPVRAQPQGTLTVMGLPPGGALAPPVGTLPQGPLLANVEQ